MRSFFRSSVIRGIVMRVLDEQRNEWPPKFHLEYLGILWPPPDRIGVLPRGRFHSAHLGKAERNDIDGRTSSHRRCPPQRISSLQAEFPFLSDLAGNHCRPSARGG